MKTFTLQRTLGIVMMMVMTIGLFSGCESDDDAYLIAENLPGTWVIREVSVQSGASPYYSGDVFRFYGNGEFSTNYGESGTWKVANTNGGVAILLDYPLGYGEYRSADAFVENASDGYMRLAVKDYYNQSYYTMIMTRQ